MAHLLHIVKHIDRNEYRESRFLIVMRLVSMMNQCFESVYMSQNSLPVGESGSQSYLLSRSNQSTDFDGEIEPGGFTQSLQTALSSEAETAQKVGKSKVEEGSEESVKLISSEGKLSESSNIAASEIVTNGMVLDDSVDQPSSGSDEVTEVIGDIKQLRKQNVDQTMIEANDLLGRLDESSKTLRNKNTQSESRLEKVTEFNGKKLPQITVEEKDFVVAENEMSEKAIANTLTQHLEQSDNEVSDELNLLPSDVTQLPPKKAVVQNIPGNSIKEASIASSGMISVSQKGKLEGGSAEVVSNQLSSTAQVDLDSSSYLHNEQSILGLESGNTTIEKLAEDPLGKNGENNTIQPNLSAKLDWTQVSETNPSFESDTNNGITFNDSQELKFKKTQDAPIGASLSSDEKAGGIIVDGLNTSEEEVESQYAQPMWSTPSVDGNKTESQAVKLSMDTTSNTKLTSTATLALHASPTQSFLSTDKMADASAQIAPQEINVAAMNQKNGSQSMAEEASSQTNSAAAKSGSAAVLGAAKLAKNNENGEKTEFSQQLAGLTSQQGIVGALTKAEAQTQGVAQPSLLQLSREGMAAGEQLAERVQMMLSKNLKNVDIRLDPPELGKMQIRMTMNSDIASVQFTVANQQTRDIIEQAMPRLREMLSQQGLQLADTSVQQQNAGQQQSQYVADQNSRKNKSDEGFDEKLGSEGDESLELDVDVKANRDGISFYA